MLVENAVALIVLIIASLQDFKEREVMDWLNYVAMLSGILLAGLLAIFSLSFLPLLYSVTGLLIGYGIGVAFYFTGQWGGGDAKMFSALGAILGFNVYQSLQGILHTSFTALFFNSILWSLPYAFFWLAIIVLKKRKAFIDGWKKEPANRTYWYAAGAALLLGFILSASGQGLVAPVLYLTAGLIIIGGYLLQFTKVAQKTCMTEDSAPTKLTEGDWLSEDVKIGNTVIKKSPTGLEKKDIRKLQKAYQQRQIKTVKIKNGVPFIPVFLLGFLTTLIAGNIAVKIFGF